MDVYLNIWKKRECYRTKVRERRVLKLLSCMWMFFNLRRPQLDPLGPAPIPLSMIIISLSPSLRLQIPQQQITPIRAKQAVLVRIELHKAAPALHDPQRHLLVDLEPLPVLWGRDLRAVRARDGLFEVRELGVRESLDPLVQLVRHVFAVLHAVDAADLAGRLEEVQLAVDVVRAADLDAAAFAARGEVFRRGENVDVAPAGHFFLQDVFDVFVYISVVAHVRRLGWRAWFCILS